MKIYTILVIVLITTLNTYAQDPTDALRYSWMTTGGTARNQAIGGAGTSLGGEFSTLFMNPAGLGFYKTDEFVLTPNFHFQTNKSEYLKTSSQSSVNDLNLGASGFILAFPAHRKVGIRNFTIGIGINKTADFNSYLDYKGNNNHDSYSQKYLEELKNNNVTDPNKAATDFPFGTSLALNTFLIDTIKAADGSFAGFKSLVPISSGIIQEQKVTSSGGINDIALGGAVNLLDKFYAGATLTVPIVNFNRTTVYRETDATSNPNNNFNYFEVQENLQTTGYGVRGKLGIIYRPISHWQLGISAQTPTLYELTDSYSTGVTTDLEGYGGAGVKHQQTSDISSPGQIKYTITSPWHVTGGVSYVFREIANVKKQRAFITADVEYVNYGSASINGVDKSDTANNIYFNGVNQVIKQQYGNAFNFRLGGELKFEKWMVRLGGAYYENPYKTESANHFKVSGGLGYRDKGIFIDLTYVYAQQRDVNYAYRLQEVTTSAAQVRNNGNSIAATIGFKF